MSATSNRKVAVQYASNQGDDKQGLIMEIDQGMLDRGASLQWLSQARLPTSRPTTTISHSSPHYPLLLTAHHTIHSS